MPPVSDKALVGTPIKDEDHVTKNASPVTKSVLVPGAHDGKATDLIGEIAARSSRIGASRSADDRLR